MIEINTQSSIKIDNIYFDPFKIEKDTKDAKIIFITHSHYDHFDIESIKKIENKNTIFVIPNDESIKRNLKNRNIVIVEPNKEYELERYKICIFRRYRRHRNERHCPLFPA